MIFTVSALMIDKSKLSKKKTRLNFQPRTKSNILLKDIFIGDRFHEFDPAFYEFLLKPLNYFSCRFKVEFSDIVSTILGFHR